MRLIDLDQTIFVPIVDEGVGTSYELQMTVGEFFDKFLDGNVPEPVDAVPVDWIKARRGKHGSVMDIVVGVLITEWRNEEGKV